jgi:hypothetical protein
MSWSKYELGLLNLETEYLPEEAENSIEAGVIGENLESSISNVP